MLEGKDYQAADMVFPGTAAFTDEGNGYTENELLSIVHKAYFKLVNKLGNTKTQGDAMCIICFSEQRIV